MCRQWEALEHSSQNGMSLSSPSLPSRLSDLRARRDGKILRTRYVKWLEGNSVFQIQQWKKPAQEFKQEVGRRNWSKGHKEMLLSRLPLMFYSVCFPIQSRTTCPSVSLPRVCLALSNKSLVKKTTQDGLQVNVMEVSSQLRLHLPRWCQCMASWPELTHTTWYSICYWSLVFHKAFLWVL